MRQWQRRRFAASLSEKCSFLFRFTMFTPILITITIQSKFNVMAHRRNSYRN